MYQAINWNKKMVSPDPAHQEKGVCDHGLFTADMQLTAKTAPCKDSKKFRAKPLPIVGNKF